MDVYGALRKLILPLETIDHYLPMQGLIVDLGCGQGVIAKYVARVKKREVIGIDFNPRRLPVSNLENLKFKNQNILDYSISNISGVILSDVLHHLDFADQKNILEKISQGLKKGGTLIVKEIDTRELIRSKLSRLWDFILYPKDRIYFRDLSQLSMQLKRLDFKVSLVRTPRLFPGSTNLLICQK